MKHRFLHNTLLKFSFAIVVGFTFISTRSVSVQERYIEQYKQIAINEMERSKIPASIKMAQALFESQSGTSELATQANNHFGIKCKTTWSGDTYQYKDDDLDKEGNLTFSCFRSYSSAIDSYKDHSDFLIGRSRYQELFSLPMDDYKSWAYGLKKCGYATDPLYAEKLIRVIEKYNLDLLDLKSEVPAIVAEPELPVKKESINVTSLKSGIKPLIHKPVKLKAQYKKNTARNKSSKAKGKKRKINS